MIKVFGLRILCTLIALSYLIVTKGQDPHFSQFYASPVLLNPALTGVFPGDIRVSGCYRDQWPSIQYPYRTGSFTADANVLHNVISEGDIAGVGLTGLFDNSNNGGLKSNSISSSLSFHKSLYYDGTTNYTIGVGFMGSLNTKILDYSRFVFGQQLTPQGFDANLATGENKNGFSTSYFDYSAGVLYSALTEVNSFYLGASMYHINRPTESFNGPIHTIAPRYVFHGGGSVIVGESDRIYFSGVYMNSESFSELTMGLVYGLPFSNTYYEEDDNIVLMGGVWYRYKDAVIPHIGIQMGGMRAGISYDVNVSQLQTASNLKGGFELTMNYIFSTSENTKIRRKTLCPRGKQNYLKWFGY